MAAMQQPYRECETAGCDVEWLMVRVLVVLRRARKKLASKQAASKKRATQQGWTLGSVGSSSLLASSVSATTQQNTHNTHKSFHTYSNYEIRLVVGSL